MSDETAERLIAESGEFHYYIETQRKFKPHTLKENEEQIINLKDINGIEAMMSLYEMITSKFKFTLEIDGETKTLNRDQLASHYRHPSPDVRAAQHTTPAIPRAASIPASPLSPAAIRSTDANSNVHIVMPDTGLFDEPTYQTM